MSLHTIKAQRLHVDTALFSGAELELSPDQSHYAAHVLRLTQGDRLLLFNGRQGEWLAELISPQRKRVQLRVQAPTRPQPPMPDLELLFAPLKHARLDYMVQKAVEMGAGRLVPVLTRHTQVARLNLARMRANVVEAAEQCGILALPVVAEERRLTSVVDGWDGARMLVFCDEEATERECLAALAAGPNRPLSVLVGPEGGFSNDERAALLRLDGVVRLSLGPRILRADTAAVAALALVQAVRGDWRAS